MSFKKIMFSFLFLFIFISACYASAITLSSKYAILVDADSGYVLDGKNSNDKIFPASTTKVLAAILAIENLDLNKAVVVTKSGIDIPWDSSKVNLVEGEVISVQNLLYCTLLSSGNDAANMLAEAVSGSVSKFVELMNEKAKQLGCTNTHFVNAHGYHDNKHYTTAYDMAIILRYAMQSETFRNICQTATYTVPATNKSEKRDLINSNRLILTKEQSPYAYPYQYALGGKTGYTSEAGRCFIGWAKKDDKYLISCIYNAPVGGKLDKKFVDTVNLFEYGFNNFKKKQIISKDDYVFKITDEKSNYEYTLRLEDNIFILANDETNITGVSYSLSADDIYFNKLLNRSQQSVDITFNITDKDYNNSTITSKLYITNAEKIHTFNFNNLLSNILYICIVLFTLNIIFYIISNPKKKKYIKASSVNTSRKNRRRNI